MKAAITSPLTVGSLIQRYRVASGLTQEQLAELAGLSVRGISDLERGVNTRPRSYTLQQLCTALALSPRDRAILEDAARVFGRSTGGLDGRPTGGYIGALPSGPLIGRTDEIEHIAALVRSAIAGEGRLVLIGGEPGIGKTRLAQEVWQFLWHRGYRVSGGRCYHPERAVPYYPFFELLSAAYATASARLRALTAEQWPELSALLPALELRMPDLTLDESRLCHAVTAFLSAVAHEAPIGLLLDDLQWADESSIRLLGHIVRHARPAPIVMLGTYRTTDIDAASCLEDLRIALSREGLLHQLTLTPLDEAETAMLASSLLGNATLAEPVSRRLWAVAEGNPFYTEQMVRDAVERAGSHEQVVVPNFDTVPLGVRDLVRQRLNRLAPATQAVLREASILGQTFTFSDLHGMTGRDELELESALDDGLGAGFLRGAGAAGYSFHALTQHALTETLTERRRQRLHSSVGSYIASLPARRRQRRAGEIARHFLLGGDIAASTQWELVSGDEAMHLHAHTEAAQSYRAALELARTLADPRLQADALGRLGQLHVHRADYEEASTAYEAAIALVDASPSPVASNLYRGLARVRTAQGEVAEAEKLLAAAERALDSEEFAEPFSRDRAWIDIQLDAVHLHYSWGNDPALAATVECMRPVVLASGTTAQQAALFDSENLVALRRDRFRGSARSVGRAREFCLSSREDGEPTARAHAGLGFALLWNDELDEAQYHLDQAFDKARNSGDRSRQVMALTYLSVLERMREDVHRTESLTNDLAEAAAATQNNSYIGVAHANRAWIHLRRGELSSARDAGQRAMDVWLGRSHGRYPFQWLALWPLIVVCVVEGETESAIALARVLFDPALQQPPPALAGLMNEAIRAWDAGDRQHADCLLATATREARGYGYA